MQNNAIFVVGYPRSGTAYLARLLGEALNSPVVSYGQYHSIADEGLDRPGNYKIHQLHLFPERRYAPADANKQPVEQLIIGDTILNESAWKGERIIHILRDPRGVAVSVMFYWGLPDLDKAIDYITAESSIMPCSWVDYITAWQESKIKFVQIKFSQLLTNTGVTLYNILSCISVKLPSGQDIETAIVNQDFAYRRRLIEENGDNMPYGKDAQLKHLRKGVVGDWRNYFTCKDGERLHNHAGKLMMELGYIQSDDWYKELPHERSTTL